MFLRYLTVVCLLATAIADLCEVEPFPCNETSTTCSSTNGTVTCSCKEDYVPSPDSNNTCIHLCEVEPRPCNETSTTCSSTNGMVTCSCKEDYVPSPDSNTTCIHLCEVEPFPCDETSTTCSSTNGTVTCSCKEDYFPSPDSNTTCKRCPAIPCPPQSECLDGVCLCISGTFMQDGQCIPAQVFPGKLHLNSTFVSEMADRSSEIFRKTAQNIADALFKALNGTQGYVRSDVVKLENGSVIATVNNIYQNTDITEEEIQEKIEKAAESNELLNGATYNITDLCEVEPFPCDETSTTCSSTNGTVTCSCKEDYVPSPDSNTTCIYLCEVEPFPCDETSTTCSSTNGTVTCSCKEDYFPSPDSNTTCKRCPAVPCPPQSQCLDGVCLCISGTFMQNGSCIAAQVFPGKLRVLSEFVPEMADRSSEIFREMARNISDALFKALYGTRGYVRSDVVKLEEGSVIATVKNIYQNTDITAEEIQEEIEKAAESIELLKNATYNITDLCEVEPFPCDETSTTCSSTKGRATCSCKQGYIRYLYSQYSCEACPSGQRAVNNECKPCPFGYSGFNCDDSSLLAVVVVSCVLGGILLIVLIFFAYCFRKGHLKNLNGKSDFEINSYRMN